MCFRCNCLVVVVRGYGIAGVKIFVVVGLETPLGVEVLLVVLILVSVVLRLKRCWSTSCRYLSCNCI